MDSDYLAMGYVQRWWNKPRKVDQKRDFHYVGSSATTAVRLRRRLMLCEIGVTDMVFDTLYSYLLSSWTGGEGNW